jgi:hypothetical protein
MWEVTMTPAPSAPAPGPPGRATGAGGPSDPDFSPWDAVLGAPDEPWSPAQVDPDIPHPIRMWDYMIGGKDNYESDREAVRHLLAIWPDVMVNARAAESFAHRASSWIADGHGLDQYLQMGTAIPIMNSMDGYVREQMPEATFVYVTDDPVTAAHARAVLTARAPNRSLHVMRGEFRDPERVLAHPWLREKLDLGRPLGVLLFGMLDYTRDDARLRHALRTVLDALAPGSLIAVMQYLDFSDELLGELVQSLLGRNLAEFTPRTRERIDRLLDGFEFLPPGLVRLTDWRPDGDGPGAELQERCQIVGGVIVKR